jgi:hypothetical protein
MIHALLKGKLSTDQANMEDILTSNVFGLLRYLPAERGLLPFLAKARCLDGRRLKMPDAVAGVQVDTAFWPTLAEQGCATCEPDVLVRVTWPGRNGRRFLVLVEAKYRSGKSSEADESSAVPLDQLAREWGNVESLAKRDSREPVLVYLTAGVGPPVEDIRRAGQDHSSKANPTSLPFECYWLSWRHLVPVAESRADPDSPALASLLLEDLGGMLNRLDLVFFGGFSRHQAFRAIQWSFDVGDPPEQFPFAGFTLVGAVPPVRWLLAPQRLRFSCARPLPVNWRFDVGHLRARSPFAGFTPVGAVAPVRWVFAPQRLRFSCTKPPPIKWKFAHE